MLSPHETFTKATHLILFLRTEDWLSRFYAARVMNVAFAVSVARPLPSKTRRESGHSGSAGSCQTRTSAALIRSPRPRPAKNISAMAKQITLKAPGNRQSLQSIPSGSPVGHRRFWPLIPDDRTGFWRRRPSRPRASPRSRNALSLVYFSRQLMTNCGRSRGRTFCSVACFWQLSTRSFCFARHAASS